MKICHCTADIDIHISVEFVPSKALCVCSHKEHVKNKYKPC